MNQHRKRDRFSKYEPTLRIFAKILRILPMRFSLFIYNTISHWHGYFAIALRYCILRAWCKTCGRNVRVDNGVELVFLDKISIGNNVSIHSNCYLDAGGEIGIGDDVSIAHQTSVLSFNHCWDDINKPIKDNSVTFAPVVIESDVWIGCGCRILAGVKIKNRSVIAAGAVVLCDVASNTIVGGVPAKVLRCMELPEVDI